MSKKVYKPAAMIGWERQAGHVSRKQLDISISLHRRGNRTMHSCDRVACFTYM